MFISLEIIPFNTMLNVFVGHMFKPHGTLIMFPIEFGGKTISMEVKVVDAPLKYTLLLKHSWFYSMKAIVTLVFHVLCFPH